MASLRSRTRLALVALVLAAPTALAQGEELPDPLSLEALDLATPPPPAGTMLDVHQDGLDIEGRAESPTRVAVRAPDGTQAFSYVVDEHGRARVEVAGEAIFTDATFLRLEGNPLGPSFTLVVQDGQGAAVPITIDRLALATNPQLPLPEQLPPVAIGRPADWPGAPTKSYTLYVSDEGGNRLTAKDLRGGRFLQRDGEHTLVAQIPVSEHAWDRLLIQARVAGSNATLNATMERARETGDAVVHAGSFRPSALGLSDGQTVEAQVVYERRLTALVAERYAEPALHKYRVDGTPPSVAIQAPAEAKDFRFPVSWNGADALTGIGGFVVDWRVSGAAQWTRWDSLSGTSATFSGEWGTTYDLRVRALDKVGNPSKEHATATTRIVAQPPGTDDVNDPPTARFLTPRAGAHLDGIVPITWEASDPDGTAVTSRLEVSDDEGRTWRVLYAGEGRSTSWDTREEVEGPGYRLRLTVKDGSQSASDALSALTVRNIVRAEAPDAADDPAAPAPTAAPPASEPVATSADASADSAAASDREAGGKDTPAPFVGIALGAAALLAARRRAG